VKPIGVVLVHVFTRRHQKASRATGRVRNGMVLRGLHQLDHHFNNVARGAELVVGASGGNFRQQIFVQIALGIAVVHLDFGNHLHHLVEQLWRGYHKGRALHVLREYACLTACLSTQRFHVLKHGKIIRIGLWLGKQAEHGFRGLCSQTNASASALALACKVLT